MTYKVSIPNKLVSYDYVRDRERWGILHYKVCMNHGSSWYEVEFKSQGHYELFMLASSQ